MFLISHWLVAEAYHLEFVRHRRQFSLDLLDQLHQFPKLVLQIVQGTANSRRPESVRHLVFVLRIMGLVHQVQITPYHGQDIVFDRNFAPVAQQARSLVRDKALDLHQHVLQKHRRQQMVPKLEQQRLPLVATDKHRVQGETHFVHRVRD